MPLFNPDLDLNELTASEYRRHEKRMRRGAARQGLRLVKSRSRTPEAIGFGTYSLVNPDTNMVEAYGASCGFGMNLDEVARSLDETPSARRYDIRDADTAMPAS